MKYNYKIQINQSLSGQNTKTRTINYTNNDIVKIYSYKHKNTKINIRIHIDCGFCNLLIYKHEIFCAK